MDITIAIIAIIFLIMVSAICSATETAFSSVNIIRIKQKARNKDKKAKIAYSVIKDYAEALTTILIVNNIANTGAATVGTYIFSKLFGDVGLLYATLTMTIMVFIFGEILPKIIAKQNAEKLSLKMSKPLRMFITILGPITKLVKRFEKYMKKRKNQKKEVTATEDELLEIIQTIETEGVLNQDERELLESAIEFDDKTVKEVMTKKDDIVFLYNNAKLETVKKIIIEHKYSRIPVVDKIDDKVVGILHEGDVLDAVLSNKKVSYKDMLRDPLLVTSNKKLPRVLEKIQANHTHMAVVVDNMQNKQFLGIVTLEDLLEELVGEIYDEYDDLPSHVVEIGHHNYQIDPSINVKEFFREYLPDIRFPDIKADSFSGWIKEIKGKDKFRKNEEFEYENIVLKIIDSKEDIIYKLNVEVLSKPDEMESD